MLRRQKVIYNVKIRVNICPLTPCKQHNGEIVLKCGGTLVVWNTEPSYPDAISFPMASLIYLFFSKKKVSKKCQCETIRCKR